MTFAEFLALPLLPVLYDETAWATVGTLEARTVSLEGYIAEVFHMQGGGNYDRPPEQGDLHIDLREAVPGTCLPVGLRGGQIAIELTPPFHGEATGWSLEKVLPVPARNHDPHLRVASERFPGP